LTKHFRYLSVVPVSRNRYKTLSKSYENLYIILYKSSRFKQIIFSKYGNNLKTIISHRNLRISGLLPLYFFCILIDIIDNIIYKSVLRLKNSRQCQCSILVTWYRRKSRDQYTALPLAGDVIRTICNIILSIKSIINAKWKLNNCNRSKPEILRFLWDIVVFRLVSYLWNMIFFLLQLLYKIAYMYMNFRIKEWSLCHKLKFFKYFNFVT